jgi:hypothetical protein
MSHPTNEILMDMAREQMEDKEWQEHRTAHNGHPSANCHYCVENADMPEQEEREELYV